MVYFKTNWIKETNQWIIRKVRPFAWSLVAGYFIFHFTYYEYLGRRVAFFNKHLDPRTDVEKQKDAIKYRTRFGYKPRYEPSLEISIKKEKYAKQDLKEILEDTPRLYNDSKEKPDFEKAYGLEAPEKTREFFYAILEHARKPGTFDYTVPQTQHAVFPDVQQEGYVTLNSNQSKGLIISKFTA